MSYFNDKIGQLSLIFFISLFSYCTKLVKIPEPINTITNAETFGSNATAESAVAGIYNDLLTGHGGGGVNLSFANGLITLDAGMSADELHSFNGNSQFETNTLNSSNFPAVYLWNGPYLDIYLANAAIENLPLSVGVSTAVRNQLVGEAKFLRAFCYFYLVNLYGDVPLSTTTAYTTTDTLSRTPVAMVYLQIIKDLKGARQLLPNDYSISGGMRVRANQGCVNALLARTWLYQQQWDSAEVSASTVINNSNLYELSNDLNSVFLINNQEAILQWQTPDAYPYATKEGYTLIPNDAVSRPNYYMTDSLLSDFEQGDLRRVRWVDSTQYSGKYYYFPSKYKVKVATEGNITENYVIIRLAELYLIRAEARVQQNNLSGAISDVNSIRERAGLSDLPTSLGQTEILTAIMQERRIELFSEWGNRWLDLKRTGNANSVLASIKPTWNSYQTLYPLPAAELINDGNLIQNPNY